MSAEWEDDAVTTAPETQFAGLEWFVEWLTATYERHGAWCPRWDQHPEAVSRLGALWDAFEELHGKPLGMARWWLQFADPMMTALRSQDGPFGMCGRDHWNGVDDG